MASTAADTKKRADEEGIKKSLELPAGWSIKGALESLAPRESTAVVTYERDPKTLRDNLLNQVFITKSDEKYWILSSNSCQEGPRTGERHLTLVLILKPDAPQDLFSSENLQNHFGFWILAYRELSYGFARTPSVYAPYFNMLPQNCSSLSIRVGSMKQEVSNRFFSKLVDMNLLSSAEARYFQSICGYIPPSLTEQGLLGTLETAYENKNYDEVVKVLSSIHQASHKEAVDKGRIEYMIAEETRYMDDSDAAFRIGERLSSVSPRHAYQAFKILRDGAVFHDLAQAAMGNLFLNFCRLCRQPEHARIQNTLYKIIVELCVDQGLLTAPEPVDCTDPEEQQNIKTGRELIESVKILQEAYCNSKISAEAHAREQTEKDAAWRLLLSSSFRSVTPDVMEAESSQHLNTLLSILRAARASLPIQPPLTPLRNALNTASTAASAAAAATVSAAAPRAN